MTRNIHRRLDRMEARHRETELTRFSDAELEARIERTAADLLQVYPARELQEAFATMPSALAMLGLSEKEIAHAPH